MTSLAALFDPIRQYLLAHYSETEILDIAVYGLALSLFTSVGAAVVLTRTGGIAWKAVALLARVAFATRLSPLAQAVLDALSGFAEWDGNEVIAGKCRVCPKHRHVIVGGKDACHLLREREKKRIVRKARHVRDRLQAIESDRLARRLIAEARSPAKPEWEVVVTEPGPEKA